MARTKKFGYAEPADYFPPEIRKMFEEEEAKKNDNLKKANTQDLEKMMAKKATKKK